MPVTPWMTPEPQRLAATAMRAALHAGTLSAEALARSCLDRVALRDTELRAWTAIDPDAVLARARELDRLDAAARGPLHGLPVGIKDVILTHDLPTQYNSPLHQGFHPRIDASCVRLLRQAGAMIFGKTDTVEFAATGRKALTRNPHGMAHTPGGSSSGSAAAVADGHVPLALGTQTGGSMMRPASFCGVWAFKPTWGLVSTEGCKSYAPTLDTLGWFARSAADLGLLLDVFDPEPAATAPPSPLAGLRIATCRTPMWARADPSTQRAFEAAAQALRAAGAGVEDLALPVGFERLPALQLLLMHAEGRASLLCEYRDHPEVLEASLRDQVLNRSGTTRVQLRDAYDEAAARRTEFDGLAQGFDAILVPSAVGEAPIGLAATGDLVFNGLWTLLHVPCINVPLWQGSQGLPVGLTLLAPRYADRQALAVAQAIETHFVRTV